MYRYQSASYDVIPSTSVTHFSESAYLYLMSRLRGANPYPKQIKSATNRAGAGHRGVKARFIDIGPPKGRSPPDGEPDFYPGGPAGQLLFAAPTRVSAPFGESAAYGAPLLLEGDWDLFGGSFLWSGTASPLAEPFVIPPTGGSLSP
jgi:hypothetical protein